MLHTLRFSLQNAVYFIMLPFSVLVLFTFYIQGVLKLNVKFKVCKSVHHRTIQINHQPDAHNFSVYYLDVCLQLNVFRAFSFQSSGAQWLQWQPLVFPSYRDDSRVVLVFGPAGPTTNTARLSQRCEGKTRGCHCSHWAPDDGRENARNMLSHKQTSG